MKSLKDAIDRYYKQNIKNLESKINELLQVYYSKEENSGINKDDHGIIDRQGTPIEKVKYGNLKKATKRIYGRVYEI